ncbi:MAG: V-type ATPase subunit [Caldilineaceae bacterium]
MTQLLDAARYAAVSARVHGLFSRLLPNALWTELVVAPDLRTVYHLLQQTWYAESLTRLTGEQSSAEPLERALWAHFVGASRSPFRLMQGASRGLLEWHWRRFEVENLKTVLRAVHYRMPPEQAASVLVPLGDASTLPWSTLVAVDSALALAERLRATWYGRALAQALDQYRRTQALFVLEVALDLAYYQHLLRLLQQLHGRDRTEAERFFGAWLDGQNLLWAYRYQLYARFSPEEMLNYTLHRHLRANAEVVRAIALGAPLWETVTRLWGTRLPGLADLQGLSERAALARLELILQRHLYQLAQQTRGAYALHLGIVLAYEVLLESEVRDLIALCESKAGGVLGQPLQFYLIGERA